MKGLKTAEGDALLVVENLIEPLGGQHEKGPLRQIERIHSVLLFLRMQQAKHIYVRGAFRNFTVSVGVGVP